MSRPLNFVPRFSCWRDGRYVWIVIAACVRTKTVTVYEVQNNGVKEISRHGKTLDWLCGLVPTTWQAMPYVQRAQVIGAFLGRLEAEHGKELCPSTFTVWGHQPEIQQSVLDA